MLLKPVPAQCYIFEIRLTSSLPFSSFFQLGTVVASTWNPCAKVGTSTAGCPDLCC